MALEASAQHRDVGRVVFSWDLAPWLENGHCLAGSLRSLSSLWTPMCLFLLSGKWKSESEVAQSCPTLCDPMGCSLPGSSVHGIFQARVLEWVAISFSRGSSRPRDWTQVSCIAGRRFTIWATWEAPPATPPNPRSASYWIWTPPIWPDWLMTQIKDTVLVAPRRMGS